MNLHSFSRFMVKSGERPSGWASSSRASSLKPRFFTNRMRSSHSTPATGQMILSTPQCWNGSWKIAARSEGVIRSLQRRSGRRLSFPVQVLRRSPRRPVPSRFEADSLRVLWMELPGRPFRYPRPHLQQYVRRSSSGSATSVAMSVATRIGLPVRWRRQTQQERLSSPDP